jgi:hypothetical protein
MSRTGRAPGERQSCLHGSEYSPTSTGARLLKIGAVTSGALLLGVVAARVADIRTKAAQRQENKQLMLKVLDVHAAATPNERAPAAP